MKIALSASDIEMTADLYHRLAQGYTNAPSLRMTWLESLSSLLSKNQRFAESAMCNIHISAMIAEYLFYHNPNTRTPHGSPDFLAITPNIIEESSIKQTAAIVRILSYFYFHFISPFCLFHRLPIILFYPAAHLIIES